MGKEELADCLGLLMGTKEFGKLPSDILADDFAENVLGFEEVEEVEDEEGEYGQQQEAMMASYSQGYGGLHNEIIPEEDL